MSVLTKVFIVLLVVVSLLTSAGLLVFVNQTEIFKVSLKTAQDQKIVSDGQVTAYRTAATAAQTDANTARKERDDMAIQLAKAGDPFQDKITDLSKNLAKAESDLGVANVTVATISNALASSEAQRKAQETNLTASRSQNDDLNKKNSDESLAIADLTSKLEVANFKVKEFTEDLAAAKAELAVAVANEKDHSILPNQNAGNDGGAPRSTPSSAR